MTKISFELFGLELLEPMAFLLNWVLMFLSVYYFKKLKNDSSGEFTKTFNWFFFFMSISFCFGGLTHLFYNYTGQISKIPGWLSAMLAISFIEYAVSFEYKEKVKFYLQRFITIKLLLLSILMLNSLSFSYVMIHTSFLVPFLLIPYFSNKPKYSYFVLGVLFLLAALPVKLAGVDIHLWFNRDDIGHTFMIGTLWCFFRGIRAIESNLNLDQVPLRNQPGRML